MIYSCLTIDDNIAKISDCFLADDYAVHSDSVEEAESTEEEKEEDKPREEEKEEE